MCVLKMVVRLHLLPGAWVALVGCAFIRQKFTRVRCRYPFPGLVELDETRTHRADILAHTVSPTLRFNLLTGINLRLPTHQYAHAHESARYLPEIVVQGPALASRSCTNSHKHKRAHAHTQTRPYTPTDARTHTPANGASAARPRPGRARGV